MSKLNYPPINFLHFIQRSFKSLFYYFLNKRDKKIYWFGVLHLLIILSTAVIFKDLKIKIY